MQKPNAYKAYKVLPKIATDFPTHRWLLVTLAARNYQISDLRETLIWMNKSWQRFSQLKTFPAIGWLRFTKIHEGKNATVYPYFHCLLMVPVGYFGRGYIKRSEWMSMWQRSLRIESSPIVDVQAVKKTASVRLVSELLECYIKGGCEVKDPEFIHQMRKAKTVVSGGILKKYLHETVQNNGQS